ncbi:DeoR/GlpR family DNA-binding transcription regulator [Alicyclobacillus fastidiosus]|uniref:DeoR/GlpR family DNA-binding transcription regulator n=1 Tax=Alicyclobacillus fastidiosus TaxID=392011 RepID=A0ABY6ZEA5_9BACL|nr:DeoR/GlpR family DNA-binding transcription regulator [Alicyclobacillus fastidiosus]WAH41143.1 DeoR/GlpR family DNA-binding transcription regulator [Alicyclobacillus fastidiosus]GMA62705.1 GntR family transcriptional regulator [Alicyclobacillus fastidiosus]
MLASERRRKIVSYIQERGEVRIEELKTRFGVSEVTLRRDLDILESEYVIRRVRGGAVSNQDRPLELLFKEKMELYIDEKKQIAKAAAGLVEDGQVVMLSPGTTTTLVARELVERRSITVITSAINIAAELAGRENITLVTIGGIVRSGSYAAVGHLADEAIAQMNADYAFVSVDGVEVSAGFTTPNLLESRTNITMLKSAIHSVIVTDHSKLGRVAMSPVAKLNEVSWLITDKQAPSDYVDLLKRRGCRVMLAD